MQPLRFAILDMYEGRPNQGMRCLRELLVAFAEKNDLALEIREFDVRLRREVPQGTFDGYISSGGPGSPLDSEGSEWEKVYFDWLNGQTNANIFFICHSFQLVCRYYRFADVCPRKSTAFGVFPVHLLEAGKEEPVFEGLSDPFYAVDSRDFQVIRPDQEALARWGAQLLCIEKERPHVPLERAIMGIRFSPYWIGTQFHPEADAPGMHQYLQMEDKRQAVIAEHGLAKWESMTRQLEDPDKIMWTYRHLLPAFFKIVKEGSAK
ncbi:type 1 glutamine amidotransferase [Dinghuibacter silviterrae]|uniref:GMP synthase-like glutamine amidotransferase n=1 Tax=Dinghuibacter silviterrae TaxID=1539049 RepID=A0A4R8DT28_9BACT|nr:GMP synthase [Dinghuibacter silviterrae]TDX01036.1 GMP synthase-like glutamine amidotransferase [Dinghuibacter silviterrae]